MTETTIEWWWPSPDAFADLTVTDTEDGWELSAPDDTELGEWLAHWSQDEEHHALFQTVFVRALTTHAEYVLNHLEQNGKDEVLPDRSETDREQTEDVCPGTLTEHESGSDSLPPQA